MHSSYLFKAVHLNEEECHTYCTKLIVKLKHGRTNYCQTAYVTMSAAATEKGVNGVIWTELWYKNYFMYRKRLKKKNLHYKTNMTEFLTVKRE